MQQRPTTVGRIFLRTGIIRDVGDGVLDIPAAKGRQFNVLENQPIEV